MLIAVLVALAAAACFAAASVFQHDAARCVPEADALRLELLIDLAHRRRWLAGLAASAAGFGLQGLALHFGCLGVVQPVILLELLFTLPFAARSHRHGVTPLQGVAALAVAVGVAVFLAAARPHGGVPSMPAAQWVILALTVAVLVGLCALVTRRTPPLVTTALRAVAAGVMFGLLSAVLDSVTYQLAHLGIETTLSSWQPYALAVIATTGEIFAQSAYQAGPLVASSPVINTLEPATALAVGVGAFGEHIAHSSVVLGVEVLAGLAAVAGVAALAHSSTVRVLR